MAKQTPMLMRSALTGRVYVVTRYKILGENDGYRSYEALEKFDITDQFEQMVSEDAADVDSAAQEGIK